MNYVFFYIMWIGCVCVCLGKRLHHYAIWEEGKQAEAVGWSEQCPAGKPLGSGIHVDVTTDLSIVADQMYPFMAVIFPDDSGLF